MGGPRNIALYATDLHGTFLIKTTKERKTEKREWGRQEKVVAGEGDSGRTRNDGDGVRWMARIYGNRCREMMDEIGLQQSSTPSESQENEQLVSIAA